MFQTRHFSDDFSHFEDFLMPPIGNCLESNTINEWASALILGVQMERIMLVQHAKKEENSSSKRYKMSKWSFGDAILVTDWKTVPATFHFISIEIPDNAQINVWLYTFLNFLNQETNL